MTVGLQSESVYFLRKNGSRRDFCRRDTLVPKKVVEDLTEKREEWPGLRSSISR